MTPAQEAKEFAAAHGFVIAQKERRYEIVHVTRAGAINEVANVGGYPAALNAMKRWVTENVPHVAIKVKTRAEIIEDMRIGLGLSPGVIEHVAAQESNGRDDDDQFGLTSRSKKYMTIEEARGAALANPVPHHPWRVWQRTPGNEGRWHQLLAFSNRAEAVKYCRQLANIRSLRNLTREIRYEV